MSQLPELPEPAIEGGIYNPTHEIMIRGPIHFTADQMRAFYTQGAASMKREPLTMEQIEAIWKAGPYHLTVWDGGRLSVMVKADFENAVHSVERAHGIPHETTQPIKNPQ